MLDVIKAANAELALVSANDAVSARQAFAAPPSAPASADAESERAPLAGDTSTVRLDGSALRIERAFHDRTCLEDGGWRDVSMYKPID